MRALFNGIVQFVRAQDRALVVIVCVALILKIMLFSLVLARLGQEGLVNVIDDGTTYRDIARNLVDGNGYSMTHGAPYVKDAMRVPVVPVTMAGSLMLSGTLIPFVVVGILLSGLQLIALWHIAGYLRLDRRLTVIAVSFYAIEPAGLMISVLAISEPFYVTMFLLAVWLSIRDRISLASGTAIGVLLGLSSLTRPIGLYAAIVLIIWLLVCSYRVRAAQVVIVPLMFLLTLFPWYIRNYQTFGVVSLSSGGVQNVFLHFGATLLALRDGRSVSDTTTEQYMKAREISGLTQREVDYQDLRLNPILGPEGIALIRENPRAAFRALVYTQVAFFTNDSYRFYYLNRLFGVQYNSSFNPTLALFQDPLGAIPKILGQLKQEFFLSLIGRGIALSTSALGLIGIFVLIVQPSTRRYGVLFLLLVGYFAAASATGGYGVTVRYRFPVEGILIISASILLQTVAWYYASHAKKPEAEAQLR